MKKLWSAKVWKFFYKYVFVIHCSSKLEIFSRVAVHATVPPIATMYALITNSTMYALCDFGKV